MNFENFIENIVDLYCTLNIIHPFREGNGRTQRIFISQLIRYNGYDINFSDIDSDYLMIATIQSAQGFTDNLSDIFRKHIIKP
ncbi:MAG: Fic family protein [Ruminococcus sp.]|nr:Fic family protein [Ruminococcus sp.]